MYAVENELRQPVGVAGLTSVDHINQKAEFSLYIAPQFQGRGYGKAALEELLRVGFYDWNLYRIWGETFSGNPAAKMFESLGFEKEGVMRAAYFKNGTFIDSIIYGMTRRMYECRGITDRDEPDSYLCESASSGDHVPATEGISLAQRDWITSAYFDKK